MRVLLIGGSTVELSQLGFEADGRLLRVWRRDELPEFGWFLFRTWRQCVAAAQQARAGLHTRWHAPELYQHLATADEVQSVRRSLAELGLIAYCWTGGPRRMHVWVSLEARLATRSADRSWFDVFLTRAAGESESERHPDALGDIS